MGYSSYDDESIDFLNSWQTLEALNGCLTYKLNVLEHETHATKIIINFVFFLKQKESRVHFIFMKTEPSYIFQHIHPLPL